ncbi:uncharacterized protein HaLaN_13455, partial [Haematococcus lacustris]
WSGGVYAVRTFLDEPILARPDLRKLVALCAIADALVERASRLEDVRPYDVQILQETEAACKELYPERSAQETLEALNLLEMFPYLEQGLVSGRLEVVASSQGSSYLSYVSLLNQLVLMSTQMYHDACNPQHHKYMAHQMALLYVSTDPNRCPTSSPAWYKAVCMRASVITAYSVSCSPHNTMASTLQGDTKPLRRAIESRFDDIKRVTESADPTFDLEQSECAALQSLSSHLPGCGAGFALAALPLPFVGSAAGSALAAKPGGSLPHRGHQHARLHAQAAAAHPGRCEEFGTQAPGSEVGWGGVGTLQHRYHIIIMGNGSHIHGGGLTLSKIVGRRGGHLAACVSYACHLIGSDVGWGGGGVGAAERGPGVAAHPGYEG